MARNQHKKKIIDRMMALGIYKPEFEQAIERCAELKKEYDILYARYAGSGFACSEKTAQGSKKSPLVTTLECLRRDIGTLETQLGLNPQGYQKLRENAFKNDKKGGKIALLAGPSDNGG